MTTSVNSLIAAARDVPLTVCPANCFNLGSFFSKFLLNDLTLHADSAMQMYDVCR